LILAASADVVTCPTCGSPLGAATRGRHTRKWLRECSNTAGCATTTVSDERPPDMQPVRVSRIVGRYPGELPLEPAPLEALAEHQAVLLDVRMRQAGEREPGEDG
jgi:hypothetical protein